MIDLNAEDALRALRTRPTLAERTTKILFTGFAALGVYTAAFSLYQRSEIKKVQSYSQAVLAQGAALIDTIRHERAIDPHKDAATLEQLLSAVRDLRSDVSAAAKADSVQLCGRTFDAQREGYTAYFNRCLVTIRFPKGGTLDNASQLFFEDKDEWRSHWAYQANTRITDPDHIPEGATYTYVLR